MINCQWRGAFTSAEVEALHAEGFGHAPGDHDWKAQVDGTGPGWVCARHGAELAGFVNVAWDGGVHALILDIVVARPLWRHGIGTRLVEAERPGGPEMTVLTFQLAAGRMSTVRRQGGSARTAGRPHAAQLCVALSG